MFWEKAWSLWEAARRGSFQLSGLRVMGALKLGSEGLVWLLIVQNRKQVIPAWRQECAGCVWGH